jgi:hypothetical protein
MNFFTGSIASRPQPVNRLLQSSDEGPSPMSRLPCWRRSPAARRAPVFGMTGREPSLGPHARLIPSRGPEHRYASIDGSMLGIDPRAARATWTVILIALLCLTIYAIRNTLFIFIVSLLFAYLLLPIVDFIVRVLPWKRSRGPALVDRLHIAGIGNRERRDRHRLPRRRAGQQSGLKTFGFPQAGAAPAAAGSAAAATIETHWRLGPLGGALSRPTTPTTC